MTVHTSTTSADLTGPRAHLSAAPSEHLIVLSWMVGCAVLAAGDIIRVVAGNDSANSVVALGWGIQALGAMLAVVGLPGIYHRHVRGTGRLGLAGLAGITLFLFLFGVFGGVLHAVAVPELLREGVTKPPGVSQTFFVGVIFALLGCVALGAATLRARLRPGIAALLFLGGGALLIGHPIGMHVEDLGLLLVLGGLAWAAVRTS